MQDSAGALTSLHDDQEEEPTGERHLPAIRTSSGAGPSRPSSPGTSSTLWTSTTPSPAPSVLKKVPGRQKESAVWWYIEENAHGNCVCQVQLPRTAKNPFGGICEFPFKGKNTTTLKGHLRSHHPAEAAIMDAHDNELKEKRKEKKVKEASAREAKKAKSHQSSLAAIPPSSQWQPHRYDKESCVYHKITEHLAFSIGMIRVVLYIVRLRSIWHFLWGLPAYLTASLKMKHFEI